MNCMSFKIILLHLSPHSNINKGYSCTQQHHYYWWRAVSATYLARPNEATLKLLQKHRTLPIKLRHKMHQGSESHTLAETHQTSVPNLNNGQCISVYIRRADKGSEMKLQPFSAYTKAIEIVMDQFLNHTKIHHAAGTKGKPAIFVGAETNAVIKEMEEWGKEHGHQVGDFDCLNIVVDCRGFWLSLKSSTS
jgi:hypothetical protein